MTNLDESPQAGTALRKDEICSFGEQSYRHVYALVRPPSRAFVCNSCCDQRQQIFDNGNAELSEGRWVFGSPASNNEQVLTASSDVETGYLGTALMRSIFDQETGRRAKESM